MGQKGLALTCFSLVTVSPPPETALATMCDWAKVKELCPESCAVADEEAVEDDDAWTARRTLAEDLQGRDRRRLTKPCA